jgi:hypothetical protein
VTRAGAAAASLLLAIGCSSSATTTRDIDAAASDAVTMNDDDSDAAAIGLDGDAGDCNLVSQRGATIAATCGSGTPPAATGGTIIDGTYVLVESRFFGVCVTSALAETLVVAGGTAQSVVTTPTGEMVRRSLSYQLADSTMTQTQSCPQSLVTSGQFSATPDTLIIVLKNALTTRVSTFMRL